MTYAPVEIRHIRLRRGLLGYRRGPVDRLLDDVTESFEAVWRERADLADRVEHLEAELTRYRDLEQLLRTTLVSAERAGQDLREQAQREARVILDEARGEARAVTREARATREALRLEARRMRTLLHAALDLLDDADDGADDAAEASAEALVTSSEEAEAA